MKIVPIYICYAAKMGKGCKVGSSNYYFQIHTFKRTLVKVAHYTNKITLENSSIRVIKFDFGSDCPMINVVEL